ncbi:MAG: DNA alkylation repair protein [Bacteroides sp.]|nr:DNA alkylation repair protein [Bacillota bacterium]MCM1393880.1 DNA alkylation repair protein [[Eubacterium] siraeum]MCM1455767.1 DNA alkylation repair protein [Bacteroides sp.]
MDCVIEILRLNADEKYADFHSKLIPTVERERILGVRIPVMRKLAKTLVKDERFSTEILPEFLKELPHRYYDEMILHGEIISKEKDYGKAIALTEEFLPYVDNWAVCDLLDPKAFAAHKRELFQNIEQWLRSDRVYTVRFGIDMMIKHYLDGEFDISHLKLVRDTAGEDYYIKMAKAWYFATALAKHYEVAFDFLPSIKDEWVLKKSVQKARESYRLTDERKEELKSRIKHD